MPLPFVPEEIFSLRQRYPKCKEKIWRISELDEDRPGLHREYIFDFIDGTRLLISKTNFNDGLDIKEHVSASWEDWANFPTTFDAATETITRHWKLIGGVGKLRFLGISPNAIPHWIVEEE